MRCITLSVAANHPHKAGRAEEGLEVAMALFVAHAESGFLVCALRRDVADQDCKLRDVVAVCMAGFENLGHQGVDQSAAPELGNRRDRLDHPRAVERVESAVPDRRRSICRRFLVGWCPSLLALNVLHRVAEYLPSAGAGIEAAQRSGRMAVMLGDDET